MERQVLRTQSEVKTWFESCTPIISFDTETTDLSYDKLAILGMSLFDSRRICYINLHNNPESDLIIGDLRLYFLKLSGLVGHNLSFDLMVLSKYNIPWQHCKLFDTMIAYHLIDEEGEKGLKKLAKKYLDVEEPMLYQEAEKAGFSSQTFIDYAMNDAYYTGKIYLIVKRELEAQELQELMRLEMEFLPCVVEMQLNGFGVDLQRVEEIRVLLEKKIFDLQIEMCEILGERYTLAQDLIGGVTIVTKTNFNSGKQLAEILYGKLKLPIPGTTPGGAPETGRAALEKLKGQHPLVDKLVAFKKCQKLMSAFVEPLPSMINKDGRVRARFNVCGTVTGRLSCDSPNLQQLPKENKELGINVRDVFIASPGYTMITCDYSGQELRVLTELSQDQTLVDSFKQGKDLHLATAKAVFGIDVPEEALYEKNKEQLDLYKKKFKKDRDKAKIVNFGIAYGKGPQGFATDFNISVDEATQIIEAYFTGMPTVRKAIEATTNEVKQQGYVRTMAGRYRRFKKVSKDGQEFYTREMFRQAFNFKIQGYSADMMRMGIINVKKTAEAHPQWGLRLLATVHDELVLEVKNDYVQKVQPYIKTAMEQAVQLCIPVVAEIGVGQNYGTAK